LAAVLSKLDFELTGKVLIFMHLINNLAEEIRQYVRNVKDNPDFDNIDFDTFVRVFAVVLEDASALKNQSRSQS
jgi:hypothetical protein